MEYNFGIGRRYTTEVNIAREYLHVSLNITTEPFTALHFVLYIKWHSIDFGPEDKIEYPQNIHREKTVAFKYEPDSATDNTISLKECSKAFKQFVKS